ncbi:hypothetical protein LCGC14_1730730, partial [marine sediment metagenome]
ADAVNQDQLELDVEKAGIVDSALILCLHHVDGRYSGMHLAVFHLNKAAQRQ